MRVVSLDESPPSPNDLIAMHLPLVKKIAGHLYSLRSFDGVPFEEYVQFGAEGLIQAAQRFNPSFGAKFETYATYRIKGAIMSGLEKSTEINQQVSTLRRMRQERMQSLLVDQEGTDPLTQDASVQASFDRLVDISIGLAVAFMLDDTNLYHNGESTSWDDGSSNMVYKQLQARLINALDVLSVNERRVLDQHYFHHESFDAIAQHMSLSRSRVSQLHRAALNRLRLTLTAQQFGELLG